MDFAALLNTVKDTLGLKEEEIDEDELKQEEIKEQYNDNLTKSYNSNLEKINIALESHENTKLLIVSKKRSISDINNLINNGYKLFGENRVQEAEEKYTTILNKKDICLHLIGPLQSNKVKNALKIFHTIQSIDRVKLVKEIQKYKDNLSLTKNFFIQVNIGMEEQKNGILPNDTESFYNFCLSKRL